MATFGWIVLIFGGGVLFAKFCGILGLILTFGGLDAIPLAIVSALLGGVSWVVFWWWVSPFTIAISS